MDVPMKRCVRCHVQKPLVDFDERSDKRGYKVRCRPCCLSHSTWMSEVYRNDPSGWIAKRHARRVANPVPYMLTTAKRRAKQMGLDFSLTREDIVIPQRCPLLGIELNLVRGRVSDSTPSLDRIDNAKGYVPGNVWVISYKANTIKSRATIEELELLVRKLRERWVQMPTA
jgi:hypothetical protein